MPEEPEPATLEGLVLKDVQPRPISPEPEPTADPAPEPAPDPTPQGDPEPAPDPEPAGELGDDLLQRLKDDHQVDLTGKYLDDAALISGLLNAYNLVGTRDEHAEYGRRVQEAVSGREEAFREFLSGEPAAAPAEPPEGKGQPEYDPAWKYQITQDEKGEYVPVAGAPRDVVEKYRRHLDWRDKQLNDFVADPEAYLKDKLAETFKGLEQKAEQVASRKTADHQANLAIEAWGKHNAKLLHQNGDQEAPLTPLGVRMRDLYLTQLAAMPEGLPRLDAALSWASSEQTTLPKRSDARRATRQPDVAAAEGELPKVSDLFDKGLSLGEVATLESAGKAVAD